jgi:DNA-binding NarL/FixJ family response regulator
LYIHYWGVSWGHPRNVSSRTADPLSDHRRGYDLNSKLQKDTLNRPRILVADDYQPLQERVRDLLETNYDIVGVVGNGIDVVDQAKRLHPDLIVLDISMPGITGIEAAHELREWGSTAKVVFLTVHEQVEFVHACLAGGAMGYVIKSRLTADLIPAIKEALCGRRFISPPVSR